MMYPSSLSTSPILYFPWPLWGRCRWFPWLPRWWWTGIYGPITPYTTPYWAPPIPKEYQITMLEDEAKILERQLELIRKRLEELRK